MPQVSMTRALFFGAVITLAVASCASFYLFGTRLWFKWHASHAKYELKYVEQRPLGPDTLQTALLIEMLGLAVDKPGNIYACDLHALAHRLANTPIFTALTLIKQPPHTLIVEYSLRAPIATLADYSNTAIDQEGFLLPLHPYYTLKDLPKIIVEKTPSRQSSSPWGGRLPSNTLQLLKRILAATEILNLSPSSLSIDLSDFYASPLGEITLALQSPLQGPSYLLRLTHELLPLQLNRYIALAHLLPFPTSSVPSAIIIDLRFPNTALIALPEPLL